MHTPTVGGTDLLSELNNPGGWRALDAIDLAQIKATSRTLLEHVRTERRNDGRHVTVISDDAPAFIGEVYWYATGELGRSHSLDLWITGIVRQIQFCDTLENAFDMSLNMAHDLYSNRLCAEYLADDGSRCDKLTELIQGVWDFSSGTREIAREEIAYMFPRVVKALSIF